MALKQETTVAKYRDRFEALSATLKEASDEVIVGVFKNRLKVRAEVQMQWISSLYELMEMAQRVEEQNSVMKCAQKGWEGYRLSQEIDGSGQGTVQQACPT